MKRRGQSGCAFRIGNFAENSLKSMNYSGMDFLKVF